MPKEIAITKYHRVCCNMLFFFLLAVMFCLCTIKRWCRHSIQPLCFSIIHISVNFISLAHCSALLCTAVYIVSGTALILLWHFYRQISRSLFITFFSILGVFFLFSHSLVFVSWCANIFVVTFIINWFFATNCFVRHGFHRFIHIFFVAFENKSKWKKTSCHKRFRIFFAMYICSFIHSLTIDNNNSTHSHTKHAHIKKRIKHP